MKFTAQSVPRFFSSASRSLGPRTSKTASSISFAVRTLPPASLTSVNTLILGADPARRKASEAFSLIIRSKIPSRIIWPSDSKACVRGSSRCSIFRAEK